MDKTATFEKLGDSLEICVTREHRFGTDAFLLSDFAGIKKKDRAADLGTGCGIIPLLWFRNAEQGPSLAYGVDIQPQAVQQLNVTVERAGLQGRVIPICADIKELRGKIPFGGLSLVTCNPPYKAASTGIINQSNSRTIARHEVLCSIDDVCHTASRLLQFGGRFCVCQRPERLLDTLAAMRQNSIEPKRLRLVQKRGDTAPWLFLAEGRKGGKPFMKVLPPLLVQADDGGFSDELKRIYWQTASADS